MALENVTSSDIHHYFNLGTDEDDYVLGIVMTELTENSNPTESEKQYYMDKSKTTTIKGYANEFALTSDLVIGDRVSQHLYKIFRNRLVGPEAQVEHIYVDIYDPVADSSGSYKARKSLESASIASATQTPGEDITFDGSLKGIGDMINGTFDITTKTFTADTSAS